MNQNILNIGTIIIVIVTIIILVVIYLFRKRLFGSTINENTSDMGYGSYSEPTLTTCVSETGLCTDEAFQYRIEECIPNKDTGRGCIDENGEQNFKQRVSQVSCIPQCYSGIWKRNKESTCGLENFDSCIENNQLGNRRITLECIAVDSTGINGCITPVRDTVVSIPGCVIDLDRSVATCQVGAIVDIDEECVLGSEYPTCGHWADETGEILCNTSIDLDTTRECFSIINGRKFNNIADLYSLGYYNGEMKCVSQVSPGFTTEGIACKRGECEEKQSSILDILKSGSQSGVKICLNEAEEPSCLKTCLYYDFNVISNISNTVYSKWAQILGKPFIMQLNGGLGLTINHIPCNVSSSDSYVVGSQESNKSILETLDNSLHPLTDCYGNPNNPTLDTPFIAYDPSFLASNSETCSTINIIDSTSTIFIVKPLFIFSSVIMVANIIAIQSTGYFGILGYDNNNVARWYPVTIDELAGVIPDNKKVFIGLINNGTFDIRTLNAQPINVLSTVEGMTLLDCTTIPLERNIQIRDIDGNTESINPLEVSEGDDVFPNFHSYLNYRGTRQNPYNCNFLYSYPPPLSYPMYDVGIPYINFGTNGNFEPFWISAHSNDEETPH